MIPAGREADMTDHLLLDENLERLIDAFIRSGQYASRSEVIRDGLWLLEQRERSLRELDAALARGLADEEAGRVAPADEVFDELRARYRTMADNRSE
jgi:antitoxin ParD1/3/4